MQFVVIYVTAETRDEALQIGRAAVEEGLAACANILPEVTSIYRWQGTLEQASEVVLLLKTREDLVNRVIERVGELHSYDCPCIVALSIAAGNEPYLQWINEMTNGDVVQ